MKEKNIFLFLDWSLTINELIQNDKIVKRKLEKFVKAIEMLETAYTAKVKLIIVSGTSKSSALKRFNILNQSLSEIKREDILCGFAFEYGAYMIDKTEQIIKMIEAPLTETQWKKLKDITKSFEFDIDKEFKSYFNIEFEKFNEKAYSFLDCCKKNLPELDFEVYDDKYGHGIDIKNILLNKGEFVNLYLKKYAKNIQMIIVGGDSIQDIKMFPERNDCKKYFIGFLNENTNPLPNTVLSKKENIDGIIDCIEKISILKK